MGYKEEEPDRLEKIQILKKYFGYDSFRKGQEEIIDHILAGQDTLAIMPTGAGKSLCYQIPALMMGGITIVISPLISLMMDQVKALNEAGVHAAYINSSLTEGQIAKALELAAQGRYKIIYVAPERLETARFLDFACHTEISMVTVDEAHCISQWGQDFRPSYLKIVSFIRQLPVRPVLTGFTATATEKVQEDIQCVLGLEQPYVAVTGFDRENLYFEVQKTKEKQGKIREYLEKHREDSGIIYCATRKNVDELYLFLDSGGFSAGRYHAGMNSEARKKSQEDFIYDRTKVMVATNAFGMGIDKSNVRFVLHFNMPQSLENYYQEAGRAGRDGEPAECIIYYSPQDVVINQFLLESKENNGEYTDEEMRQIQEQDMERLRQMTFYCTTRSCLRSYILNYFGEQGIHRCGNCSNCLEEFEQIDAAEAAADIVQCVREARQRFGINVIAGTLLGENTAKIRSYGLESNSCYGKQSKLGQNLIREIIYTMAERGYLQFTKDKYALIRLTQTSDELLEAGEPFIVSYKKEEEKRASKKTRKSVQEDNLTSKGLELFEELRKLRTQFAKEKSIPPYMVASDKTLHDMCVKIPVNKIEMMQVNGMGERKFEQYGERFLARIQDFTGGEKEGYTYPKLFAMDDDADADGTQLFTDEAPLTEKKARGKKEEFSLTDEIEEKLTYTEEITISDFVSQINDVRDEKAMKRLTIKTVTEHLISDGYLETKFVNGYTRTLLTEKGKALGIRAEEKVSKNGNPYEVFLYGENAQRFIVERLKEGWGAEKGSETGIETGIEKME